MPVIKDFSLKQQSNWLRIAVHATAWILLILLLWRYLSGNLTFNPIQAATQYTGKYALIFLVLSLSCTPLTTFTGSRVFISVRRVLGLYAFFFATIHLIIFTGFDYGFDRALLQEAIFQKPFVIVGATAWIILMILAATSFRWWMKFLGKNWLRIHRFVYLAAPLIALHYAWSLKGDFFRLQGDILQPLLYGIFIGFLLFVRIPPVANKIRKERKKVITEFNSPNSN